MSSFSLFQTQCEAIVSGMFPPEGESVIDIDAALDTVVLKVSQDLINDIPAGDPRWMEMRVPGMLKEYCVL